MMQAMGGGMPMGHGNCCPPAKPDSAGHAAMMAQGGMKDSTHAMDQGCMKGGCIEQRGMVCCDGHGAMCMHRPCMLPPLAVHALTDFPLQMPGIALTFFAVLGWTLATANRRLE